MEEKGNGKGNPEQNFIPKTGQREPENTYWEAGIQNQYSASSQDTPPAQDIPPQDSDSSQYTKPQDNPPLDNSSMDTPAQFYEYYQQQMNGATNSGQQYQMPAQMLPTQTSKKKSHKKLIVMIFVILVIISAAATAYAFKDTILNTVALMTKSPAEYYSYVEKKAINDIVDKSVVPYQNLNQTNTAYDTSVDITYDHDTVNSLLKSTLGIGLDDTEGTSGFTIDSLGIDALVASKDGNLYENLGLRLNQVDIITLEIFMDTVKQELLLRLPELSPALLRQSLATGEGSTDIQMDKLKLLTPERTADFIKRYGNIVVDHIDQVVLSKNSSIKTDTLSATCNKLTINLDNETYYAIISAILQEAKEDEYIYDLLSISNVTKEDYQKAVTDAEASIQESYNNKTADDNVLTEMVLYVNSQGDIIGRDINMKEKDSSLGSFGYALLSKKNYEEYNIYVKGTDGTTMIRGFGNQTAKDKVYNGKATLELNNISSSLTGNVSFDLTYSDVRTVWKDKHAYYYGNYSVSSLAMMGIVVLLENSAVEDVQQNKLILQMGNSPLLTVDVKTKYLEDYSIPTLTGTEETYDSADYKSYLSSLDLDTFITNLSDKLGVNLQNIMDSLAPYLNTGSTTEE